MTNQKQAIDDGGPAFPTTKPLDSWGDPNQGMTLRDYFAAKAMQGLMSSEAQASLQDFANASYRAADAMIKARKGGAK